MSPKQNIALLIGISVAAVMVLFWYPPIPQDPAYHNFADQRVIAGIPHFGDVISNAAFLAVGMLGLWHLFQLRNDPVCLIEKQEALPVAVVFAGTALIALGSGYYHWAPSNETLVWDRLPMTLAFMGIFSMILAERIHVKTGVVLLVPLLIAGVASVMYWQMTEQSGHGDLRPYILVQFLPMLLIPLLLWLFPARYTGGRYIVEMIGWYGLAKGFEFLDADIWEWTDGWIGGHALKHLTAAWGIYALVRYLKHRRRLADDFRDQAA